MLEELLLQNEAEVVSAREKHVNGVMITRKANDNTNNLVSSSGLPVNPLGVPQGPSSGTHLFRAQRWINSGVFSSQMAEPSILQGGELMIS